MGTKSDHRRSLLFLLLGRPDALWPARRSKVAADICPELWVVLKRAGRDLDGFAGLGIAASACVN